MRIKTDLPDLPGTADTNGEKPPAFSGSLPRFYNDRLGPMIFDDYADDLARRLGPIERGAVLETAAGTGIVSRRLRARLPSSTRLAVTDLSPDMLDIARESLEGEPGVEITQADATALPFADEAFAAVVCQFGVMFFPDEPLGYREAARVLAPGGRLLFNVWDDLASNPVPGCVHEAYAALAPDDPPRFLEKPFRELNLTGMVRDLQRAGFAEIRATVLPKLCRAPSARDTVDTFLHATPLGPQLVERGLDGNASAAVARALADRFAEGDETAPFTAPMRAVVFEAVKPA